MDAGNEGTIILCNITNNTCRIRCVNKSCTSLDSLDNEKLNNNNRCSNIIQCRCCHSLFKSIVNMLQRIVNRLRRRKSKV